MKNSLHYLSHLRFDPAFSSSWNLIYIYSILCSDGVKVLARSVKHGIFQFELIFVDTIDLRKLHTMDLNHILLESCHLII